ncbi:T9SS type A sorting domain-containing protein [Terrimonas ferruginea]|uniref:T9SS type A sorting domain-containing protein n=1 Tax=Terrimonas ferruginea TaxID=249 RepID=UPI0004019E94|nr:T9SS type A sorting domain-containing protein [Terrimonas ferruginea]
MKRIILVLTTILFFNSVQATIYYVDAARADNTGAGTSWGTAKRDVQAAIIAATTGDEIWIKAGNYLPTHDPFGSATPANNRDKTFMLKEGVRIYGGFAGTETLLSQRNWITNVTTLSGDLGTVGTLTDNAYHVVMTVNLTNASVLDGVTITGGYATAAGGSRITVNTRAIDRYKGGGIYNAYSATTFTNCTIRNNSADCNNGDDDSLGAGMVIELGNSVLTDCIFDSNSFIAGGASFGVFGAGMSILGGNNTLTRCVFANNLGRIGFTDGSRGGALDLNGTTVVTNCIFYNNQAMNGGAISAGGDQYNTSTFSNCTFANNTSSFAGTAFIGFAFATFTNCIFSNNNPVTSSVANRNEIYSQETRTQFQPRFINCIIRDAAGSTVTNTSCTGVTTGSPSFVNVSDGDGGDDRWGTGDDGLRLQCASSAIGGGTGSTPATDFLGLTRITPLDLGAYKGGYTNANTGSLPTSSITNLQVPVAAGINHLATCSNLVASLQSGGAYTVSGNLTVKTWIQGSQPVGYVRRNYEITPGTNAATATGRVTLYFTQADFDAFNNQVPAPALRLPQNSGDATGKANLLIEKKAGTSSNNTGLPNTYSGGRSNINPVDADIIWNAGSSRWEVTFDVTGFSGFFVKTSPILLPLNLISFTGTKRFECNTFQWKTENETNTRRFEIERSSDAQNFQQIGTVSANGSGNHQYKFDDCNPPVGKVHYRLRMIDIDETYTFSNIVTMNHFYTTSVDIFPNPVAKEVYVRIPDRKLLNTTARIIGINGAQLITFTITEQTQQVNIGHLPAGTYVLELADGTRSKIVKVK